MIENAYGGTPPDALKVVLPFAGTVAVAGDITSWGTWILFPRAV
jgi:hypothetical protein